MHYTQTNRILYAYDSDQIDVRGSKPLRNLINTVGVFPVLNSTWNETDFNIEDLVINLHELGK